MVRHPVRGGLALIVALAVAACGGAASQAPSKGPAAPSATACEQAAADAEFGAAVTIRDFAVSPDPVSIRVGEAIAWTNQDSAPHTATMEDGSCATSSISQGSTAKLTFSTAGTYTYKCAIHPGVMKGFRIEVGGG